MTSPVTCAGSCHGDGIGFLDGQVEVTNAQYACFDPNMTAVWSTAIFCSSVWPSAAIPLIIPTSLWFGCAGKMLLAFCQWLSAMTGETFSLPTEAQWEYACRAGTTTPLWYGELDADFAAVANLADESLAFVDTYPPWNLPSGAIAPWRPAMRTVNDNHRVSAPVGSYNANPWGLFDMHGNVAEWTLTSYGMAPDEEGNARKVVRGGSWYDLPERAHAAAHRAYHPWQPVYDVGFRVVAADSSGLETK
jgi:formylglycine-generating enzyme required for sulfatase activity